jgi:hypothetical protein
MHAQAKLLAISLAALASGGSLAETGAEDANTSNNPLTLAPAFNLQDYYSPVLFGTGRQTNDFLLRGALPLPPTGFVPVPQIIRATVPLSTRPDFKGGYTTGLGDINIFDIFLLKTRGTQIGVGPQLTAPSATDTELGTRQWQAGLSAVAIHPTPARLLGALVQWQHSFAGSGSRPDTNILSVQPFVILNFPGGWYARSTGIMNFNLENGGYYIPIGLGIGKVWKSSGTIFNLFIEPQYSVAHSGSGAPQFTVFAGLNMTFPR